MTPLVICWWNRLAVALTGDGPLAFDIGADPASLAEFIVSLQPGKRPVVIVYDSPAVEHFPTACPVVKTRQRLIQSLANSYPMVANPGLCCSFQAPWTNPAGASTVVHIDGSQNIPTLRAMLASRGVKLLNAIHLPSLIDGPSFPLPLQTPSVVIIQSDRDALLYRVDLTGQRHLSVFHDDATHMRCVSEAKATFESFPADSPPAFVVVSHGTSFPLTGLPEPTSTLLLIDLLKDATRLARLPLASVLPQPPLLSATAATWSLAAVLALVAGSLLAQYLLQRSHYRHNLALQAATVKALLAEVEPMRTAKNACSKLTTAIHRIESPPAGRARFLERLGTTRPPTITFHEVQFNGANWSFSATLHEGVNDEPKGPFRPWFDVFMADSSWVCSVPKPPTPAQPEFSLFGKFSQ